MTARAPDDHFVALWAMALVILFAIMVVAPNPVLRGAYDKMLAKYGLADNKLTPISINKGE